VTDEPQSYKTPMIIIIGEVVKLRQQRFEINQYQLGMEQNNFHLSTPAVNLSSNAIASKKVNKRINSGIESVDAIKCQAVATHRK